MITPSMQRYLRCAALCAAGLSWATALEVTGLTLIDATGDSAIAPLTDFNKAEMSTTSFNVRADTDSVGSVRFVLSGPIAHTQTESAAPYALFGDSSGDYKGQDLPAGSYTLQATPYSLASAGGTAGATYTVNFTVSDDGSTPPDPSGDDGDGSISINGERKRWHKVTLDIAGPWADEQGATNPFLDYRMEVVFSNGSLSYTVPGYFAADGNAANSSASAGNVWRAHLRPDLTGTWQYAVRFYGGANCAVNGGGSTIAPYHGKNGSFSVGETDKTGRDLRAKGRLEYVGERYLKFAGSGEYFLKQGADAPENFLAYADFDGNFKSDGVKDDLIKDWAPHTGDWTSGDPTWQNGKGKGIIGAINYLASEGMNAFSFLTMNIIGDDRNVFPYTGYGERVRMDVSKLDQWEIVFAHGERMGMYLHFKTQETENETLLDGGNLGTQRKLYYRELIARFGHHLALNWNLCEESNDQTDAQRKAMAQYFWDNDPYRHNIVIHSYPGGDDGIYTPLLGSASKLTGTSLQLSSENFTDVPGRVREWVQKSTDAGKPWVVAVDEPGDASHAIRPDNDAGMSHVDGRKHALWGTLCSGGAGNEYYFGYAHAHSDLTCNDFRSRDQWWDYPRYALDFFDDNDIPFWRMQESRGLTSVTNDYTLAAAGEVYVIALPNGGSTNLDLSAASGSFDVRWFDPRNGGALQTGSTGSVNGGGVRSLGNPPNNSSLDWVVLVRAADAQPPVDGVVVAINSGGGAYTAIDGTSYDADGSVSGGSTSTFSKSIAGTDDDTLYESERWGNFAYAVPVANGDYTLVLHFAEVYFSDPGARIFDVMVEGAVAVDDLDLVASVGALTAYDVSLPVTVNDGVLDIVGSATVNNAKLAGFRLLGGSAPTALALDVVTATVSGVVSDPAATVTVNGQTVSVQADGSWSIDIALPGEASETVLIEATDSHGQTSLRDVYIDEIDNGGAAN